MSLWFGRSDDDWREALKPVEARVRALEEALTAQKVERADWAERMERLFNRIRMASARAHRGAADRDDQAALIDPPEAKSPLENIRALRRTRGV